MSDDESIEVDSVAEEDEGLEANDVSAASTSASTPQPAPQPAPQPTPAMLQELLQLRAKQAIEGAKARGVVRENQRMAIDFVHCIVQRVVCKLGWVEEAKHSRDRNRKKNQLWSSVPGLAPDRPSRRRERKRESRMRQNPPEFEEVPGGGQFLMMLLKKKQSQHTAGSHVSADEAVQDATAVRDPAIVQASLAGWPTSQRNEAATTKPEAAPREPTTAGTGKASGSRSRGKANGSGESAPRAEPAPTPPPAPANKGMARAAARAEASERRRAMAAGAAAAAAKVAAKDGLAVAETAKKTAGRDRPPKGAQNPEQLNLQSLLRGAGITENGPDDLPVRNSTNAAKAPQRHSPAKLASQASSDIFGKLQKLMGAEQDKASQSSAPVIPPMPGFATIWGSPSGAAPSSSPSESPWLGSASDPWAPLPPSALDSAATEHNPKLPPPLSEVWPGQEAPRNAPDGPTGVEALETRPRGRRGGRNHKDKKKEVDKKLDLWDMPMNRSAHADVHNSLADLPEFFRDSTAPAFVDYFLEESSASKKCGLELELELDFDGPSTDWNGGDGVTDGKDFAESPNYDGAIRACIGSLCLEEDDDDDVLPRGQIMQIQFQ